MVPDSTSRTRLLQAMAALVSDKGYAAVTIGDLAREARISKRTFYDHFPDKERCFLAAYDAAAAGVYERVRQAAGADLPWRERLDAVLATYLRTLAARPDLTRVFHVEIQAAGPDALARRHDVTARYAELLCRIVREGGETRLDEASAFALLGAAHELVLLAVAHDRIPQLPSRLATLRPFVAAALAARSSG